MALLTKKTLDPYIQCVVFVLTWTQPYGRSGHIRRTSPARQHRFVLHFSDQFRRQPHSCTLSSV